MKRLRKLIFAISFFSILFIAGAAFAASPAAPKEFDAKLVFVFDDGTVMLYLGSEDGLVNGAEYQLSYGNVKTGRIKLTEVMNYCAKGKIVSSVSGLKEGEVYNFQLLSSFEYDEGLEKKNPSKMKYGKEYNKGPSNKKIRVVRKNIKVHK